MIYKNLIEDIVCKNTVIIFCNKIIEEDVQAVKFNKKYNISIRIRTKINGGRSGNLIEHGPSVKLKIDNIEVDLYIKKDKSNKYYCELDRKCKNSKEILKTNGYKIAKKFVEKNAKDLVEIYYT